MVFGKVLGKESMELVRKIEALGSEGGEVATRPSSSNPKPKPNPKP